MCLSCNLDYSEYVFFISKLPKCKNNIAPGIYNKLSYNAGNGVGYFHHYSRFYFSTFPILYKFKAVYR